MSNLVKLQKGELRNASEDAVAKLHQVLVHGVEAKRVICVDSIFHETESSLLHHRGGAAGRQMFHDIWKLISQLSQDLRLHTTLSEILWRQIEQQAALLEGTSVLPPHLLWKLAFERDPQDVRKDGPCLSWRLQPEQPNYAAGLEINRTRGELGSFNEELALTLKQMRETLRFEAAMRKPDLGLPSHLRGPSVESLRQVIDSKAFEELPYVYCKSRLVASLLSESERGFQSGDFPDLLFASYVLPYCHLMVVDSNLSHRIHRFKLDERYGTVVFGNKAKHVEAAAGWVEDWTERSG